MRVGDVMTSPATLVGPETPVRQAAKMMADLGIGVLPIVEHDRLIGIITDRDLVIRVLADERDAQTPVGQICTANVVTVTPHDALDAAAQVLVRHRVRRVPVVEDERVIGILSQTDLARHAPEALTGSIDQQLPGRQARGSDADLDQTLADSFPASDPPPMR